MSRWDVRVVCSEDYCDSSEQYPDRHRGSPKFQTQLELKQNCKNNSSASDYRIIITTIIPLQSMPSKRGS